MDGSAMVVMPTSCWPKSAIFLLYQMASTSWMAPALLAASVLPTKHFTTCMTGEFYALLTTDSTLSRLAAHADRPDWDAFDRGLAMAASSTGHVGILNTAFSARILVMTGQLTPDQVEDYLSGLLIGHELAGIATSWLGDTTNPILLCGNPKLNDRYRRALETLDIPVELGVGNCAAASMWHVADVTGLIHGLGHELSDHPANRST